MGDKMRVVDIRRSCVVPAVVLEDKMMDTKEALKELEDLTVDYGNRNEEQIARLDEAIDMAMEALRNLPNRLRQAMDTINRKEAIDEVCKAGCGSGFCGVECDEVLALRNMPSAQPEKRTEEHTETHSCDCISRQDAIRIVDGIDTWQAGWRGDAIESMKALPSTQPDLSEYSDKLWKRAYERGKAEALAQLEEAYISGETEAEARFHAQQRWIPCSERLPERNRVVLVTTKWDEVTEGVKLSGNAWFIGRGEENAFDSDIIAWMPLPEPYAERRTDGIR